MRPEYGRQSRLQGAIAIIGAAITYGVVTPLAAGSVVFGACTALLGTLFLAWRFGQGERHSGAEAVLRQAYQTAAERFVIIVFLLAVGLKLLQLEPLWLLAGFIVAQIASVAGLVWIKKIDNEK